MDRIEKISIISALIEKMEQAGSWCGETHIQKAVYSLETLFNIPTNYDFILYKHGPFSFGLRDDLTSMRADGVVGFVIRAYPYGPSLKNKERALLLREQKKDIIDKYEKELDFISRTLGKKGVNDLEKFATSLFIEKNFTRDEKEIAVKLNELKPHISIDEAGDAVKEMKAALEEVNHPANG